MQAPKIRYHRLENYEYSQALTHILLAYFLNDDSTIAIRKTARKVRKRVKSDSIKAVLSMIIRKDDPVQYLNIRLQQIQDMMPLEQFMELGIGQKPEEYDELTGDMLIQKYAVVHRKSK